jgi:hypothetical protein
MRTSVHKARMHLLLLADDAVIARRRSRLRRFLPPRKCS